MNQNAQQVYDSVAAQVASQLRSPTNQASAMLNGLIGVAAKHPSVVAWEEYFEQKEKLRFMLDNIVCQGAAILPSRLDGHLYFKLKQEKTFDRITSQYVQDVRTCDYALMTPDQLRIAQLEKQVKELTDAAERNRPKTQLDYAMMGAQAQAQVSGAHQNAQLMPSNKALAD